MFNPLITLVLLFLLDESDGDDGAVLQPVEEPVTQTYEQVILADNPVAYWPFNETSGILVKDVTGNGHDGTLHGGVTLGQPGVVDGRQAAAFDGSTGYIEVPGGEWTSSPELTVEAWINVRDNKRGFETAVGTLRSEFVHLQCYSRGNTAVYTDSGSRLLPAIPQDPLNVWRHIAMVVASGDMRLYVDGQEVGANENEFTTVRSTDAIHIGNGYRNRRFFNGLIDEVAIYHCALSTEQLQAHIDARG